MIKIILSNESKIPIYKQIYNQLSEQIIKGDLSSNYGLPSIRTFAKELRVSIITIKKAWEILEREGFIYTVVGKGSFVKSMSDNELETKKKSIILSKLSEDLNYYKRLGLNLNDILEAIKEIYNNV